jgi:hypothetical protein
MSVQIGDTWFRVSDPWDENDPPCVEEFTVIRVTPAGVRLHHGKVSGWSLEQVSQDRESVKHSRFVLNPIAGQETDGGRRYAYPTIELARGSWIIRKQRQKQRAAATHDRCAKWLDAHKSDPDGFWANGRSSVFRFALP